MIKMELNPANPALAIAMEKFLSGDPAEIAGAAGAKYDADTGMIECVFMGRPCYVSCSNAAVEADGYFKDIFDDSHRVLVLNNLLTATGRALSGKLITHREVRGTGAAAIAGMHGVSTANLERIIGNDPGRIFKALEIIPGSKADLGDASIRVSLLSRVPVTFVFWSGEGNVIPPSINILFDSTVCDYIPHTDIPVVLCMALPLMEEACAESR